MTTIDDGERVKIAIRNAKRLQELGFSVENIATILCVSQSTVYRLLKR